jgi:hypothetical protein
LIAGLREMDGVVLRKTLCATFDTRETHALPLDLPDPPFMWIAPFRQMAGRLA